MQKKTLDNPDLILCPGLFDYLEHTAAVGLLRLFWQQLAPGGTLLVGNFAPNHATRAYMEWIGNWYLNYRSYEAMVDLADRAEIPTDCLQIGTEATGSDWFSGCTKNVVIGAEILGSRLRSHSIFASPLPIHRIDTSLTFI